MKSPRHPDARGPLNVCDLITPKKKARPVWEGSGRAFSFRDGVPEFWKVVRAGSSPAPAFDQRDPKANRAVMPNSRGAVMLMTR